MNSQADNLRQLSLRMKNELQTKIQVQAKPARVIAITSGKGGVGKSNFAVNLALALIHYGHEVVLLDADLGLANIDVILGISPAYNLAHVMTEDKSLRDIIFEGPRGLKILPGGNGIQELANLKDWQIEGFLAKLGQLEGQADYLLIDTSAGLSNTVLSFVLAADEVIVITTTEPTAITDAYGMIKSIRQQCYKGKIKLVVNRVTTEQEAIAVYNKLRVAISRFLKYRLEYLGMVREDAKVIQAVKEQNPFFLAYPVSGASQDIQAIAAAMSDQEYHYPAKSSIKVFFNAVAEYFRQV